MLKWLALFMALFAGVAHAQSFLSQTDLPTCLARSQAQCQLLGCDGTLTKYWWACQKLTNGQAAIVVQPSGPFAAATSNANGSGGLSAGEQSSLQTPTQLGTALPYVVSIINFRARFTAGQIAAIVASPDTVVTTGWNAINGAATTNLTSPSVINTINQMVLDGLITPANALTILTPVPTP